MLKCFDPATGDVIERLCCDDRRTVHRTFRKLEGGQRRWRTRRHGERAAKVGRVARLLRDDRARITELLVKEVGTPVGQARREVQAACRRLEQLSEGLEQNSGASGRKHPHVEREPYGVVAHLSTWSFPCLVGLEVMAPALIAGNAVLYKPSEHASLTGRALVELMWEAGIPEDVVDVVIGDGSVGDYVLDESVAAVFFTGAYTTGQMISEKLASRMIPQHMDLGGKDGAYVCEDVDIEAAAGVVAKQAFYNSGRGKRAFDRVYVHEKVYRPFTDALCRRVAEYQVGNPRREATSVGPVVDQRRVGSLEHQVGDAVRKGARILLGGRARRGKGFFFEPTVLVDVDHRMLVMREECCGPVLALQQVCDDHEAVHRLRDTDYGMTAGVFTADGDRARRVLGPLAAGSVYWNNCGSNPDAATGGDYPPMGLEVPVHSEGGWRFTRPKCWMVPAH